MNDDDVPRAAAGSPRAWSSSVIVILAGGAVAALAAVLVWAYAAGGARTVADVTSAAAATREPGTRLLGVQIPDGKIAADFTLESESGHPLRLVDQRGKLVLIAFLYSRCTDVCPLIAVSLDSIVRQLGKEANSVRVLAVSVDPVGDTLPAVRAYIRSHHLGPEFHYLIGTREQLMPVWRDYNIAVREVGVEVVHAAPVLLVDRRGRARVYYQQPERAPDRRALAHDLRVFLNSR